MMCGIHNYFLVSMLCFLTLTYNFEFLSALSSLDTGTLPEDWKQACEADVDFVPWKYDTLNITQTHIHHLACVTFKGQKISFSAFRNWSLDLPDNETLGVSVECAAKNTTISLPWSFKAKGLVYLKVSNCLIMDFYNEPTYLSYAHVPDTLLYLEVRNSRILTNFQRYNKDVKCGSRVLEKLILHGVEHIQESVDPSDIDDERPHRVSSKVTRDRRILKHKCEYLNLKEWTEQMSSTKTNPLLFFQAVLSNSLFPSLQLLDISNSNISEIPEELKSWRDHAPTMRILNMSHNAIRHFDFVDYGRKDDKMGIIDLSYNNIKQIMERDMKRLLLLRSAKVELSGNPIDCSCDNIQDLFHFVTGDRNVTYRNYTRYVNPSRYGYFQHLVCAFPTKLKGIQIGDLIESDISCDSLAFSRSSIISISLLAVAVVVIATIIVVVLKYRREIAILVYTRLHVVLPCQPIESQVEDDRKTYDAFVSFSSLDEKWVYQTLVPRLENCRIGPTKPGTDNRSSGLSLCLHHRDFDVGVPIGDNVVKSVESSRHTLLVLSRNFIVSQWCVYEFQQALQQSITEKKRHMVIAVIDDVTEEDLDSELGRCLKTFTYIRLGDPLFWDRIIYSIAKGHKVDSLKRQKQWCTHFV